MKLLGVLLGVQAAAEIPSSDARQGDSLISKGVIAGKCCMSLLRYIGRTR